VTPRVIELVGQARRDLGYGAARTQLWLRRGHEVRVAMGTIQRIFRDLGIPYLLRPKTCADGLLTIERRKAESPDTI